MWEFFSSQLKLTSADLKGADDDVELRTFLGSGGDSKLIGRNSFRSLVGLAPALLGVHTTGGASSPSFCSWLFLTLESSVMPLGDFRDGDQTPAQQEFISHYCSVWTLEDVVPFVIDIDTERIQEVYNKEIR
jgi:hypothetical protein